MNFTILNEDTSNSMRGKSWLNINKLLLHKRTGIIRGVGSEDIGFRFIVKQKNNEKSK